MKFKTLLPSLIIFLLTSTMLAAEQKVLIEIRSPKILDFSNASLFFVGERTIQGSPLKLTTQREEGVTNIFQEEIILSAVYKENRFAVITSPDGGRKGVSHVCRLLIHQDSKPSEWSQWRKPDYSENSEHAVSNFMGDLRSPDRSTNVPSICFEVRYKVE